MVNRDTGSRGRAILGGLCLAAVLGCAGKYQESLPLVQVFNPARAAVRTSVVISGRNFHGIGGVSIGSQPAAWFHVDSDEQITAGVPANAMTGTISVRNGAGQGNSTTSLFVIPDITDIQPRSAGPGDVITLTGYGMYGSASLTFNGVSAGPGTWIDPNTRTAVVPVGAAAGPVVLDFPVPGSADTVAAPTWTAAADPDAPGNLLFTPPS